MAQVIKVYSVSLDDKVVDRTKEIYTKRHPGTKLSPLINELLEKWCEKEVKVWERV